MGAVTSPSTGNFIGADSTLKQFSCAAATRDPGTVAAALAVPLAIPKHAQRSVQDRAEDLDTMLGAASTYPTAFGLAQAGIDQVTLGGYQAASGIDRRLRRG